ncbi:hypothetical protein P3102_32605 [Amycolatopsis sp. QT-25]|uniref:hypothetical protein n=1 Tax=Amycolatopsis sp. QT-25 TaxID=3034022 RepID=UPI0023EC84BB|nr:hypothetical protein [Amycolatopsis sp. QT-25]WET78741.1 hypothetical protein P3102_32605 [Amycolatopsis sp. QT-25]
MRTAREMRRLTTVFLEGEPEARFHSGDLRRAAHLTGQRLSALLEKLRNLGWVDDGFDESSPDRLPYYVLTDVGRRELTRP